jgi:hypothetical protein
MKLLTLDCVQPFIQDNPEANVCKILRVLMLENMGKRDVKIKDLENSLRSVKFVVSQLDKMMGGIYENLPRNLVEGER